MKRVLVALLAISMAAGVLTGCGSKGSDKTFTVGFDAGTDAGTLDRSDGSSFG